MSKMVLSQELGLTPTEQEIITLKSVLDMINNMVNHTMFDFLETPPTMVMFKDIPHREHFCSLLVDFLSSPNDFFPENEDFLYRLKAICDAPKLGFHITELRKHTMEFIAWLDTETNIPDRFSGSVGKATILISRRKYLRIGSMTCKHNPTNLTWQVQALQKILKSNNILRSIGETYQCLESFREEIVGDIIEYHVSTLAEFLNNIRIGIYNYLNPVLIKQIEYDDEISGKYKYNYPEEVNSDFGKTYFWDLMNCVRSKFCIKDFKVIRSLKLRY